MPSLSTILAGFLAATAIVAGLALWRYDAALTREAAVRASLDTAEKANASLIAERDRYKADAKAEADRAIARQRERDGLAAQTAALRQQLGDSLGACKWTDQQAKAIDDYLKGATP